MNLVTLIIPTYNRPELLKRILNYYNNYNINFSIIVADSSKLSNKNLNKKIVHCFPKLKILYLDKFSPDLVSHHKFGKTVNYVKTKYCVFCADDDFVVPNGIKEAVDFLEKNTDYSAAHGTYIHFYIFNNPLGIKKFWWNYKYSYESITSSNSVRRLADHLANYNVSVLWAVRRTNMLKVCYKEFLKSDVNPWLFGELLPDIQTLIYGKMKRLNNFYSARQAFSTSYSHWPTLKDAIAAGTYNNEYAKFKACLIGSLAKNSNLSKDKLSNLIDLNMKIHIGYSTQEHITGRVNVILKNFSFLLKIIELLHAKYLFSKPKKDPIGLIDNYSSKYFNDFNRISQIILGHKD